MRPRAIDLTGQRFSRLLVLSREGNRGTHAAWRCRCDCGNEVVVAAQHLKDGSTKACGCLFREAVHQRRHGRSRTVEHNAWANMRTRCHNKRHKSYKDYGGRGITVDLRWDSFETFFEDMGPRPGVGYSIERKDNEAGYSKANCIWATAKVQRNNSRQNVFLAYEGKTQTLKQWAEQLGINYKTLQTRWYSGQPAAAVLSAAALPYRRGAKKARAPRMPQATA